jgi:putative transposase
LFRISDVPLSTLVRRLLTGYVFRFYRKHRRYGQLFQNRYKSIICQEDAYFKEVVRYIQRKNERIKGDQRILGGSEFVSEVLQQADARYERYYALRKKGYSLATVEERVCGIYGIDADAVYSKSRVQPLAEARGLFCYWAVESLGYKLTDMAKRFGMTGPGVGYAVRRGRKIAQDRRFKLFG